MLFDADMGTNETDLETWTHISAATELVLQTLQSGAAFVARSGPAGCRGMDERTSRDTLCHHGQRQTRTPLTPSSMTDRVVILNGIELRF